ncbi:MAG: IS21 family transposase [Betaproteobacteria bacterium]|nr:IS21 family transposase [Betaproteobacteria bacterium]
MISRALEAEILRLHHAEGWPIGTIATQLRVHHGTVRRVLTQAGVPGAAAVVRATLVDPYRAFILQSLEQYPSLRASRLYTMVRERGYPGAPDHFRVIVARLRPRPAAEAYLRLRTLPAEQGQVDWAFFGKMRIGRALRPLMAFVMVLSYSRMTFLRFYLNAAMGNFLRGHVQAFAWFQSCPRVLLYDNLKSAVLERSGDAIRFHPRLLELAAHYHFQPRPVAPFRGNEKGRVERTIRYARDAFFAARSYRDLEDLNAQALTWCTGQAADRPCPEDRLRSVREVFAEERAHLLGLPENPFPTDELLAVEVGKTPYLRFDLNDYSVPHRYVRRTLTVLASEHTVRVVDGNELIATHPRSFDRAAQIEDPAHIEALVSHKRAARPHRAQDRLHHSASSANALFVRAASRGAHLGVLTRGLLQLLDTHGAPALERAIQAALAEDAAHLGAVRHFIDQHARADALAPPIAVALPADPRVRELTVRPHSLHDYEQLARKSDEHEPDDHPDPSSDNDEPVGPGGA